MGPVQTQQPNIQQAQVQQPQFDANQAVQANGAGGANAGNPFNGDAVETAGQGNIFEAAFGNQDAQGAANANGAEGAQQNQEMKELIDTLKGLIENLMKALEQMMAQQEAQQPQGGGAPPAGGAEKPGGAEEGGAKGIEELLAQLFEQLKEVLGDEKFQELMQGELGEALKKLSPELAESLGVGTEGAATGAPTEQAAAA